MAGIDLGKQVGPLPLGAWLAVVGGGLAIAYWQRNSGTGEVVDNTSTDTGTGSDINDVGTGPSWTAVPPPTTAPTDGGTPTYDSNEAWGQAAINWLIAQGYNPGVASSAITKALNGGVDINGTKMSIQEWSLWSLALTHMGSPPYPVNVPPPTSVPGTPNPPVVTPPGNKPPVEKPPVVVQKPPPVVKPPPPKPSTTKVPAHYVETVKKRTDTVSSLAAKHGKGWQETWNFNLKYRSPATAAIMKARGPNLVFIGTTIWVPK